MATILPSQIGYTISGANNQQSQVYIGKDLSLTWEAIGFGPNGRPDLVENIKFNLTLISGQNTPTKIASIGFGAADIQTIVSNATTLTSPVTLSLVEVIVCNNGQSGRMMVLGSTVYN